MKAREILGLGLTAVLLSGCAQQPTQPPMKPVAADSVYIIAPRSANAECRLAADAIDRVSHRNMASTDFGSRGGCVIMNMGMGIQTGPLSGVREIKVSPIDANQSKVVALPNTGTQVAQLLGGSLVVNNLEKNFAFRNPDKSK
jgi:hypothetical protein